MASNSCALLQVTKCSLQRPSLPSKLNNSSNPLSSTFKPLLRELNHFPNISVDVPKAIKEISFQLLDGLVDFMYEFVDQPLLPSQSNFAPVEEIGEGTTAGIIVEGKIPDDFPETKAPGTGELVIIGIDAKKPYFELGVISADGKKMVHKADLKFDRCTVCHEIGVTRRYNVIMNFPLTVDITRLILGGQLMRFEKDGYARIGIMPRYGDANSIKWFEVDPCCVFHIINCFEHNDEVVVRACRARQSVIPGPSSSVNHFDKISKWFKRETSSTDDEFTKESTFPRVCEWRLNMNTGEVKEKKNLSGDELAMEFPIINEKFSGFRNKFAYLQVVELTEMSGSGFTRFGGLAKLHFEEKRTSNMDEEDELIKAEYHMFPKDTFCSGASFVPKPGGIDEDDGWIITFTHNENENVSQVCIIDAKKFTDEPVAIITLPSRVPYGFHGAFMPVQS